MAINEHFGGEWTTIKLIVPKLQSGLRLGFYCSNIDRNTIFQPMVRNSTLLPLVYE